MFYRSITLAKVLVGICLSTCFSAEVAAASDKQDHEAESAGVSKITPFVELQKESSSSFVKVPAGAYTRLEIAAEMPASDAETLKYLPRNLLWRVAIGRKYNFKAIVDANVGFYSDSIPLVERTYESSKKVGESFDRTVDFDNLEFPYFLAGSDSKSQVARLKVQTSMSSENMSDVAGLSLTAVRNALNAVAPTSGVVTSLTKESVKSVADKVDAQASKLFGTAVVENVSFDIDLAVGTKYKLTVRGPYAETNELRYGKMLGKWTIGFANPKLSIFSDTTCDSTCSNGLATYSEAIRSPSRVLAFKLVDRVGELGAVRAYLLQQDWWAGEVQAVNRLKTADAGKGAVVGVFCRKIRVAVGELGLNEIDGHVVAISVARSGLVSDLAKGEMEKHVDCKYT